MAAPISAEPSISLAEAAARLRRSYFATHDLLLRGRIRGARVGRSWRVASASVDAFLTAQAAPGAVDRQIEASAGRSEADRPVSGA